MAHLSNRLTTCVAIKLNIYYLYRIHIYILSYSIYFNSWGSYLLGSPSIEVYLLGSYPCTSLFSYILTLYPHTDKINSTRRIALHFLLWDTSQENVRLSTGLSTTCGSLSLAYLLGSSLSGLFARLIQRLKAIRLARTYRTGHNQALRPLGVQTPKPLRLQHNLSLFHLNFYNTKIICVIFFTRYN